MQTDHRHKEHVAIIGNSSPTKMCVCETVDEIVGVVITRTTIPASQTRIRTELNHSEWQAGTRESGTMTTGTDDRIDVVREIWELWGALATVEGIFPDRWRERCVRHSCT